MLQAKILISTFILGMFVNSALADSGLFVEPLISYEVSSTTITYPSPFNNSTGTLNGLGLGGRFGFHLSEFLFIALDARYAKPTFTDSSNNLSSNGTEFNYGPVFGVQMPLIGLRFWGGYILGGELETGESQGVSAKFSGANGYRLGAGFHIVAVSLNLEYQNFKYNSTTLEMIGPFSNVNAGNNISLQDKAIIASVSFPFEF